MSRGGHPPRPHRPTHPVDAESAAGHEVPWVQLDRPFGWTDLLLPERQQEQIWAIVARVRERATGLGDPANPAGVICAFVGERGTGKTMAAQVLGRVLARPVFEVDLRALRLDDEAEVESVFAAAERASAILVFDANRPPPGSGEQSDEDAAPTADVSALVQRCWRFPGLAIFTWLPGRFFSQALAAHAPALAHPSVGRPIRFPFPPAQMRGQLWRALLPHGTEMPEFELQQIARSYALSGGAIKHCCHAALAEADQQRVALSTTVLIETIEREYPGSKTKVQSHIAAVPDAKTMEQLVAPVPDAKATEQPRIVPLPTPEPTEEAARRQRVSPRAARRILLAVALLAACVGVVLALATSSGSALKVPDKQASNGLLRVTVPGSWRQQDSAVGLAPGLTDRLALAPATAGGGVLVLGRAQGTDPNALARQLTGVPTVPAPQIVSLNGTRFYRYSNLLPADSGSAESLYALPTTVGTVLGVCATQAAGAAFTATCERVLASLRLTAGNKLGAGPNADVGAALDRVIASLSSARTTAEKRFSAARTASAQASAASALATAYSGAASALVALQAGPADAATAALAAAFRKTAGAYAAMAHAAAQNNAKAYRAANAELSAAARAVDGAVQQLRALGYQTA